jgi:hypothetical protein
MWPQFPKRWIQDLMSKTLRGSAAVGGAYHHLERDSLPGTITGIPLLYKKSHSNSLCLMHLLLC